MADTEEIEVNFRLDAEGRTALNTESNTFNPVSIDYATKCIVTRFVDASTQVPVIVNDDSKSLYDELLLDCEICDSALMPRTFWVPAPTSSQDTTLAPRCTLEQMARDIFDRHTRHLQIQGSHGNVGHEPQGYYDPASSGAEWWVQLRPSPETTGRYAVLGRSTGVSNVTEGDANTDTDIETNGISFHWDKDEDLRLLAGGSIYVHPHLSTVTYLTGLGAPTLVVEGCRINNLTGEWIDPAVVSTKQAESSNEPLPQTDDSSQVAPADSAVPSVAAFVSWPFPGKHLCFDGRYLHAAPSNLQPPGSFRQQCSFLPSPPLDSKVQQRRHRRCTFLVNIWLNHKPFNVNPFPDSMIDKLSGYCVPPNDSKDPGSGKTCHHMMRLSFDSGSDEPTRVQTVTVRPDRSVRIHESTTTEGFNSTVEELKWPLGDHESGEVISTTIPVETVQSKANVGGNVKIQWKTQETYLTQRHHPGDVGLYLIKEETQTTGARARESFRGEDVDEGQTKRRRQCDDM